MFTSKIFSKSYGDAGGRRFLTMDDNNTVDGVNSGGNYLDTHRSGDDVWDWIIQTREAVYSICWTEISGYVDTDILLTNQEWESRIHTDDQSYVAEAMQTCLNDNQNSLAFRFAQT